MGRRFIYFCDNCGEDFKNDIHINIKNSLLYISYPKKTNEEDPTKSTWEQKNMGCGFQELHFCNGKCAGEYVDKKIANLIEKLHLVAQLKKKEGE